MDQATILVVDDTPDNILVLKEILQEEYTVLAALDGKKAIEIAISKKPDMILLDIMMPEIDGYSVCKALKSNPITSNIPIIFVTAKSEEKDERYGLELGAVDYIQKPVRPSIVKARVNTHLALYDQKRELSKQVEEQTKELKETRLQIIHRLGQAAEYKDNETGLHVIRIGWFSKLLAEKLGFNYEYANLIFHAAPMHDIGKIGIPDNILLKPGRLTEQEFEIMKKHAEYGSNILGDQSDPLLVMAKEIAMFHHEKWNGSGYPRGLSGEDIPICARIVALADVFDALTSERPYKKAWSYDDAFNYIEEQRGMHFDPTLTDAFLEIKDDLIKIKERFMEYPE